jgi:hypothetical protein
VVGFPLKSCSIKMTGRMRLRGQLVKIIADVLQLTQVNCLILHKIKSLLPSSGHRLAYIFALS